MMPPIRPVNRVRHALCLLLCAVFIPWGQGTLPVAWGEDGGGSASLERITADLRYLTSDELEGRGPETAGLQKAAEHIRDEFARAGLQSGVEDGSFFQPFEVPLGHQVVPEKTSLTLQGPSGETWQLELDEQYRPLFTGPIESVRAPVVFVGYGISAPDLEYDDYRDLDVEGKVVLMIRREPQQGVATGPFEGEKPTSHSYFNTKLERAAQRKAAAILFVNDPYTVANGGEDTLVRGQGLGLRQIKLPFAQLTLATADRILGAAPLADFDGQPLSSVSAIESRIDADLRPRTGVLEGWTAELTFEFERQSVQTVNVVGVLEGEGPWAQETLVIGAHYDHLGYGGVGSRRPDVTAIHYGADDNASGTAAVIELARRFAAAEEKPPRRLVFIAFSGEERGLIGSRHYVQNPLYPLSDTIAMLNFDMIGNLRNLELQVQGVGSGEGLEAVAAAAAEGSPLAIQTRRGVMGASDHFSFYQNQIPVTFFFTGLTEIYHTPDDTFASLNVPGIELVVDYAAAYASHLAQLPDRPKYAEISAASRGRPQMAYLGVIPDYGADNGMLVQSVKMGSPADEGGLQAGDRIVRMGEVTVADIDGLAEGLRKYQPGETVEVAVKRGDLEVTLLVTLGEPGNG
jgi:hypothetical protein